jgi:hypothetical protein
MFAREKALRKVGGFFRVLGYRRGDPVRIPRNKKFYTAMVRSMNVCL